jgi:hypothetical protein
MFGVSRLGVSRLGVSRLSAGCSNITLLLAWLGGICRMVSRKDWLADTVFKIIDSMAV